MELNGLNTSETISRAGFLRAQSFLKIVSWEIFSSEIFVTLFVYGILIQFSDNQEKLQKRANLRNHGKNISIFVKQVTKVSNKYRCKLYKIHKNM